MKKIKRIFSIVLPMLFLNVNSYAAGTILERLTGPVKILGIIIGFVIIALIIFIGYTTDKKQNEKPDRRSEKIYDGYEHYKQMQELPEEDFEMNVGAYQDFGSYDSNMNEKSNIIDSEKALYEDDMSSGEEESLYNSVNEYVEEREKKEEQILEEIGLDNMVYNFNESEDIQPEEIVENDDINSDFNEIDNMQEDYFKEEDSGFTFDTVTEINTNNNIEIEEDNFEDEEESIIQEDSDFTFDTAVELNASNIGIEDDFIDDKENIIQEENSDFTFDTVVGVNEISDLKEEVQEEYFEDDEENVKNEIVGEIEESPIQTVESKIKRYTGKKIGKKAKVELVEDIGLDFEDVVEYDDEDDEDIGVPTFDELLKQSEEDENFETVGNFDFMTEMEENLKKHKEIRTDKKTTTKKETAKKEPAKKTTAKKTTAKKTTTKKTAAKKTTTKKKKAE